MIPAPMPSPIAVYHYDTPKQYCIDNLTGTVECYKNEVFPPLPAGSNTVPASIGVCSTTPNPKIPPCYAANVDTLPITMTPPHLQLPCVGDEPRIKGVDTTGWLQLYDKHDHLLGEIQCQRGRIIVRKPWK